MMRTWWGLSYHSKTNAPLISSEISFKTSLTRRLLRSNPFFVSQKINDILKIREKKPSIVNQQRVLYKFKCDLCDTGYYIGYTMRHLHEWVEGVMSRIERSYENCEIYDNLQDHWQSLCNLFKALQGGPVQSYENCKNYEIYENCEIYDNSPDLLQYQGNLFKGPSKLTKITKFTKTAKFRIIRHTICKNEQNLFEGLQGRPMESYENYEIYENCEIYDNSPDLL